MRAVITVIGKDMVGILAKVSTRCAEHQINFGGLRERKRKRHRGNPIDSAGSFRYDYAGGFGKSHSSL